MANILIVDDDQNVLSQIPLYLEPLGYVVETLAEPEFLMEALENFSSDLILLDINMPGLDGVTLLKQLKKHSVYSTIPVIMLTGDDNVKIQEECLQLGAVDFLHKPVNEIVLRARIRSSFEIQNYIQRLEEEIVERKKAEAERKKLQDELLQFQKMKSLGTLVGGLAHDFNNLFAIILGNVSMLEEFCECEEGTFDLFRDIQKAGARGKKVIDQLLVFTQIEQNFGQIQIDQPIWDAVNAIKAQVSDNFQILVNLAPNCPDIWADKNQIYHAVINLCSNSVDSMNSNIGEKILEVTLTQEESWLHLSVSDTGHGISEEIQTRIFDPFFSSKGVVQNQYGQTQEGSGLGLFVVYNIVQAHQGQITVKSEIDQGSTFHLYFPYSTKPFS